MNKKKIVILVVCLALLGGIFAFAVVMNKREAQKYKAEGKAVAAQVVGKYIRSRRRGKSKDYCLRLRFVSTKGPTSGIVCNYGVTRGLYRRLRRGDKVVVMYLPRSLMADGGGKFSADDIRLKAWVDDKAG